MWGLARAHVHAIWPTGGLVWWLPLGALCGAVGWWLGWVPGARCAPANCWALVAKAFFKKTALRAPIPIPRSALDFSACESAWFFDL